MDCQTDIELLLRILLSKYLIKSRKQRIGDKIQYKIKLNSLSEKITITKPTLIIEFNYKIIIHEIRIVLVDRNAKMGKESVEKHVLTRHVKI